MTSYNWSQLVLVDLSTLQDLPTTSHDLLNQSFCGFRAVFSRPEHTGLEAVVDQSGVDLYTLVLKVMKVLGHVYDWS